MSEVKVDVEINVFIEAQDMVVEIDRITEAE